MYNSVVCSSFNVRSSWDGLHEGRNCVWLFWFSELCSVDQTVTVHRGSAGCEGFRVIFPALFLTLDEYSSWRVERVVPIILSAVRTTLRSLLRSDLVAELNQTAVDVQRMDSMMSRTVSTAPVTGWTSSAGEGSTASAGPLPPWT